MSARRAVIDHIRSTFNLPNKGSFNLLEIWPLRKRGIREIPLPLEKFMAPEPDIEGHDDRTRRPSERSESVIVLGSYRPMRSPGLITLYQQNLTEYFWSLTVEIEKALRYVRWTENDLSKLAEWTVDQTFWHERFHHSMDVLRHLLDVQSFDCLQEEALAVAFSRYYLIQEHRRYRRRDLSQVVIWDEFIKLAYQYRSPGYCDWVYYADPAALKAGICDYLSPNQVTMLKSVRVPVADMLFAWLPVETGFEERVV